MSYVAYENIASPDDVVEDIAKYVKSKGYTVVQDYSDDNDIYGGSITDGKKLVFKDKTGKYYVNLRSCNGYQIFGTGDEGYQDTLKASDYADSELRGVGMTVSEGYSASTRWYNQYRVPNKLKTQELLGVYMPVPLVGEGEITAVAKPDPVPRPDDVPEPVIPTYPVKPIPPTTVTDGFGFIAMSQGLTDLKNGKLTDGYTTNAVTVSSRYYSNSNSINFDYSTTGRAIYIVFDYPCFNIPGYKLISKYNGDILSLYDGTNSYSLSTMSVDDRLSLIISLLDGLNSGKGDICGNHASIETCISTSSFLSTLSVDSAATGSLSTNGKTIHTYGIFTTKSMANGADNHINYILYFPNGYDSSKALKDQLYLEITGTVAIPITEYNKHQSDLKTYDQHVADTGTYDTDMETYNATVKQLNDDYANDVKSYNTYSAELAKYNSYIAQLNMYNDYLDKLAKLSYKYTLFCNEVVNKDNTESTLIFSLMKTNGDWFQVSHLVVGNIDKYDTWEGGIYFSGSANRYNMIPANKLYYTSSKTNDSNIYPVLSSGKNTNTFLRIDIDNAPHDSRGNIRWASSGEDNITGKKLSLAIRTGNGTIPYGNGEIPHFYYLQSHSRLDSGRNVNTLNCITLNLPIYMAVNVDPDELLNYAPVGEVRGVYFISMYNLQTSSVYTINSPDSSESCQGFSVGKRRGYYGFDGISILQQDG